MGALKGISNDLLAAKQKRYYDEAQQRKGEREMANDDQKELDLENAEGPVGESKAERFSRVVNPRLKAALRRIRMIKQMFEGSTAANYEYTEEQRSKLVNALFDEVEEINRLMHKRLRNGVDDDVAI